MHFSSGVHAQLATKLVRCTNVPFIRHHDRLQIVKAVPSILNGRFLVQWNRVQRRAPLSS